jgi:hypothetical protein
VTSLLDRFVDRAKGVGGTVGAIVVGPDGTEVLALDADGSDLAGATVDALPLELAGGA